METTNDQKATTTAPNATTFVETIEVFESSIIAPSPSNQQEVCVYDRLGERADGLMELNNLSPHISAEEREGYVFLSWKQSFTL